MGTEYHDRMKPIQYMSNEENAEVLYTMFSRLLDRKIEELRRAQETRKSSDNDDIKVPGGRGQRSARVVNISGQLHGHSAHQQQPPTAQRRIGKRAGRAKDKQNGETL